MIDWIDLDELMASRGYQVRARYATIGDCPPDVAEALGAAADARHAVGDDDGPPTEATLGLIRAQLNAAARRGGLPDAVPIRSHLTPAITLYERPP
jgi:hypothetical protein